MSMTRGHVGAWTGDGLTLTAITATEKCTLMLDSR